MAKGKATKAEQLLRTKDVIRLLRRGATRPDILRYAAKKWNASDRTVDIILQDARNVIKKEFEKDLPHMANEIIGSLDHVYKLALTKGEVRKQLGEGDYKVMVYEPNLNAAIQAKMGKAKILGLLKTPLEITLPIETGYEDMSPDDLRSAFNKRRG